jgi:hypothetical protein
VNWWTWLLCLTWSLIDRFIDFSLIYRLQYPSLYPLFPDPSLLWMLRAVSYVTSFCRAEWLGSMGRCAFSSKRSLDIIGVWAHVFHIPCIS